MKILQKIILSTFFTPIAFAMAMDGNEDEMVFGSTVPTAQRSQHAAHLNIPGIADMDEMALGSAVRKAELLLQAKHLNIPGIA